MKRWRLRALRAFAWLEGPCAWLLMFAGFVTFMGVIFGLIVVGEARLVTLLTAASLMVSGFTAVQTKEDDA